MEKGRSWNEEDLNYLKRNWGRISNLERMSDKLKRSVNALRQKANQIGLHRDRGSKVWPPEKVRELKKLYSNHTNEEIGKILGCTSSSVQGKALQLHLHKDKAWMLEVSRKGQFQKGHTPKNKGKKWKEYMSEQSQEACRLTTFKKGILPPNYKPVGWERKNKDGYWEVKVEDPNVFKAKHRILWEQHNGPIPKGMNIVFVDGNPDNIVIENLRAETMVEKFNRCCSIHTTLPPEIRELVQLKGALNRQINKVNGSKPKRKRSRREEQSKE